MFQNSDRSDKRHRNRKVYRVDVFKLTSMKDLKLFTQSELSTLETLNIMGGTASAEESQTGCSNNVAGCNCTIIQLPPQQPSGDDGSKGL